MNTSPNLNTVPYVNVDSMMNIASELGVGFATEDFSALQFIKDQLATSPHFEDLDIIADPDDPRDLFGMIMRAKKQEIDDA